MRQKKYFKLTNNIYLKLITLNDARLIYNLRTNKKLSKYLNPTSNKLSDQILWMKKYFTRNNKDWNIILNFN